MVTLSLQVNVSNDSADDQKARAQPGLRLGRSTIRLSLVGTVPLQRSCLFRQGCSVFQRLHVADEIGEFLERQVGSRFELQSRHTFLAS
jgi:hypothetical protein